jgi:hypothetical protein
MFLVGFTIRRFLGVQVNRLKKEMAGVDEAPDAEELRTVINAVRF